MHSFAQLIAKFFFSITLTLCAATVHAQTISFDIFTSPYFGLDTEMRYIQWGTNQGDNIFKRNYPQAKAYGGLRFCDYVGLEIGYEASLSKTATNSLSSDSFYLGQPVGLVSPVFVVGTFQIEGPYAALIGFFPISCDDNLFLSLGGANLKATHQTYVSGDGNSALSPATNYLRFTRRKTLFRVAGGWEHLFCDCLGIRLNLAWENTKRFNQIAPENNPARRRTVSLKDSWNYGVGIFYRY